MLPGTLRCVGGGEEQIKKNSNRIIREKYIWR
jgi:hypothetical protein